MKNYMFETTTTMKEYNRKKWWIDSDIIRPIIISAENLKAALQKYRSHCDDAGVTVSENALRTKQVGYVITGKTEFNDNNYKWVQQYVDLWVRITEVNDVDFEEEAEI